MKPIKFPESNVMLAENQPEYNQLPIYRFENGDNVSCWKLSLKERIILLFTGKLWISMKTFNNKPMPILPTIEKDIVIP